VTRGARQRRTACVAALVGVAAWLGCPELARAVGPVGSLVVDCTGIEGFAQDPDLPDAFIDVHLYFGGPAGDPAASAIAVTADRSLAGGCEGNECVHGYRSALPMSLLDDGDHAVHAYGIDLTGDPNLELWGSPAVLSCPAPPIVGGELRHVVSPEILGAWQFSIFFDRLIVVDSTIAGLSVGPVVDVGPQLRVDAGGGLWVIDQGRQRAVAAEVAPAWRLAAAAAVALAPEELALPEGTALRPRPVLLQTAAPEVWLLDDHQCGPGDPDPSCVADETGGGAGDDTGSGSGSDEVTGGGADADAGGSDASAEDSGSDGSAGVVTGLPPLARDDEAAGCGCRASGRRGAAGGMGLVLVLAVAPGRARRARSRKRANPTNIRND
jgi:hypothetical protein